MIEFLDTHPFIKKALPYTLLMLAVMAVYANSLWGKFVWDDDYGIVLNSSVRDFGSLFSFFNNQMYAGAGMNSNYWRPMLLIIFSFQWHTFGTWFPAYHILNVALHGINACLIFFLFRKIFKRRNIAFFSALVFAVHPLNTEAIAYISGLADPLAVFFMLMGTIWYVRARNDEENRRLLLLGTFLAFILALMSKESAIVMPGLLLLSDIFSERNKIKAWKDAIPLVKTSLPYFGILAFYILLRITIFNFLPGSLSSPDSLGIRMLSFSHAFVLYLELLFAPLHLHMERVLPATQGTFTPIVVIGVVFLLASLSLIITQFKKRPEISFGLAWFFIAVSPNANIFFANVAPMAEHWLYLSLPGFFFAIFVFLDDAIKKMNARKIIFVFFLAWLAWIGTLTVAQNRVWHDPISLYLSILSENHGSYRVLTNIGSEYEQIGNHEKALYYYAQSLKIRPNSSITLANIGKVYLPLGKTEEALRYFKYSVNVSPTDSPAFGPLLQYYMTHKEYENARMLLEQRLTKLTDPFEQQKILLALSRVAENEGNDTLSKQYEKRFDDIGAEQEKLQNGAQNSFINFLFP